MSDNRVKHVAFVDEKLLATFSELKSGKFEEKQLVSYIERAIDDLKENPLVGIVVPMKLCPREYIAKFNVNNLRKYDLPNGWRLVYTLKGNQVEIISVILEWFSHKEYEKRFGYRVS